jgi:hypothetical protein
MPNNGSMTNFTENLLLDSVLGATANWAPSASGWLALYPAPPSVAGGGTELNSGGYARVAFQNNGTNWPNATTVNGTGWKSNAVAFEFGTATVDWGNISAFSVMNAAAAGNMVVWGLLTTVKNVASGDVARFPSASLVATLL